MQDDQTARARLPHAGGFRDLIVYQRSREMQKAIYSLSSTFPKHEQYSLTDQVRRSSRSIGAQIAESWAKRRYEKHFISKLTDGLGELFETEHWIETACESNYIEKSQETNLLQTTDQIGKMLSSMIAKSSQFCNSSNSVREDSTTNVFNPISAPKKIRY